MRFRHGFIEGSSRRAGHIDELLSAEYDVAVLAGSWDDRCLAITSAQRFSAKAVLLISFADNDPGGKPKQEANEEHLRTYLANKGVVLATLEDVTEDVNTEFVRLWDMLLPFVATGRTRVFVDLSACPRYYTLGVIAGLLRIGLASQVDVLYSEATYPATGTSPHPTDVPFSEGRWRCEPIPYLNGQFQPSKPLLHVVSVGFEGGKTVRLLEKEEATHVTLLFPIPGVIERYDAEVWERNKPVIARFSVPEQRILRAQAADPVAAWRAVVSSHMALDGSQVKYLCCGTKAHSLGLALSALRTENATVMYNVPEKHRFVETVASGTYWLYRIRDLSVPEGSL